MRNKSNIQSLVGQIEAIQQSFIQFARNTPMSEQERAFMDRQVEASRQAFEQIRTFLNQEDEEFNQQYRSQTSQYQTPQLQNNIDYGISSGRF